MAPCYKPDAANPFHQIGFIAKSSMQTVRTLMVLKSCQMCGAKRLEAAKSFATTLNAP